MYNFSYIHIKKSNLSILYYQVIKFKQVMMVKIPEYRKINYYDISKVRCLQHLLAGYNRHQIGRIPDNVMAASINDGILKDVRFRCFPVSFLTTEKSYYYYLFYTFKVTLRSERLQYCLRVT